MITYSSFTMKFRVLIFKLYERQSRNAFVKTHFETEYICIKSEIFSTVSRYFMPTIFWSENILWDRGINVMTILKNVFQLTENMLHWPIVFDFSRPRYILPVYASNKGRVS
jgi:hypothetical protein